MAMKSGMIKNRAAASIQITAEQLIRESHDRQEALSSQPTRRRITDSEELAEYRLSKRKAFEDEIRRQREHLGTWIKYACWEESQQEFQRARSVFERALEVDYRSTSVWLKYAEMEMKHEFVNHARNVWDRAITVLPRVNQLWYKYAYMEEMVGNREAARNVFERWMKWEPEDTAWFSYIKFEMRAQNIAKARAIYERFLFCHPVEGAYIKYAKWEMKQHQPALARTIYERAMAELRDDEKTQKLYIAFAEFEANLREYDRARGIYQYALDRLDKSKSAALYNAFVLFEKKHGENQEIDHVILAKRRAHYEAALANDMYNYDLWFDYLALEQAHVQECQEEEDHHLTQATQDQTLAAIAKVRELYERAIAQVPVVQEKPYWVRYIYLWINYALFEELDVDDTDKTRQVYQSCLQLIPHAHFTFSKLWIYAAQFELRQRNLEQARKLLGNALGRCPKRKLYRYYIELELELGEIERCRTLYAKYLQFDPMQCHAWIKYAQLEASVGEYERVRSLYEVAVGQPVLDCPEVLWKAYIDFELSQQELDRTRALYERLLKRTQHVKVWCSWAKLEEANAAIEQTRDVYARADQVLKDLHKSSERYELIKAWVAFEERQAPNSPALQKVQQKVPKEITKTRMAYDANGNELGQEEYLEYLFPDDDTQGQAKLKLLQAAAKWKQKRQREEEEEA